MSTHNIGFYEEAEAILMRTHIIGFYEEMSKIITLNYHQISSNTHLISSAASSLVDVHE